MVTLFFMIMTAFIEIIMPHLISTSYRSCMKAGFLNNKKSLWLCSYGQSQRGVLVRLSSKITCYLQTGFQLRDANKGFASLIG